MISDITGLDDPEYSLKITTLPFAKRVKQVRKKVTDDFSKQAKAFLASHAAISVAAIERIVGMPATTLAQKNKSVPIKYRFDLMNVLVQYGFQYDGFQWEKDPDGFAIIGFKREFVKRKGNLVTYNVVTKWISDNYFN